VRSVLLFVLVYFVCVLSYYVSLRSDVRLFVVALMPCFRCLCLLAHSGVQHILCCVFALASLRLVHSM
jgi:hypothetical protein